MTKRKSKIKPKNKSRNFMEPLIVVAIASFIFFMGVVLSFNYLMTAPKPIIEAAAPSPSPPDFIAAPDFLVDKAMALPGAIVISPHRDLKTMGIVDYATDKDGFDTPVYLGAPAIAVHEKTGWCIWVMGACGREVSIMQSASVWPTRTRAAHTNIIPSCHGYQKAYDDFAQCAGEQDEPLKVRP